MTQVTVKELAQVVNTPVERLLQQMREAGLPHSSAEQAVTDSEKQALLAHLKSSHGDSKTEEPRKITLQRKTTSTLRVAGSKTISVEVRKKKTFVKRSAEEIEAEKQRELAEQRAVAEAARVKAEEEAKRRAAEEAKSGATAPAAEVAAAPAPVAVELPVVAAPPVEERKKDEPRRPDKMPIVVVVSARPPSTVQALRKRRRLRALRHVPLTRKATASVAAAVAKAS